MIDQPIEYSFQAIQHLIAIKFVLILFLVIGVGMIYKKVKLSWFLLVVGVLSGIAYAIFVNNLELLFFGLQGDEITIAAMFNSMAHGSFFSDFAYQDLPPFYPPLFFWSVAVFGRLFSWNGVIMTKAAAFSTLCAFPVLTYLAQTYLWKGRSANKLDPGKIAFFLAPLCLFLFLDNAAIIGKPYELLAAIATLLWFVYLQIDVLSDKWNWKHVVSYSIVCGLIFMTYYLWLIFASISFALAGLFIKKDDQFKYYGRLAAVAGLALIVALPYLGPLVHSYAVHGSENWQAAFFLVERIAFNTDFFYPLSWQSLLLLGAIGTLIVYRKERYIRSLLLLFMSSYIWWGMGLTTIFFYESPMQEFKGFYFYNRVILAFALAYGIEQLWNKASDRYGEIQWKQPVLIIGLLFLSSNLFFGSFTDNPKIRENRVTSAKMPEHKQQVIQFLIDNNQNQVTLLTSLPEVLAFTPINNYIYFNQHNSHPAAGFSERKATIDLLPYASGPEVFYTMLQSAAQAPIERLVLSHFDETFYLYFHLDSFGKGISVDEVLIPDRLITDEYFSLVFKNKEYEVWDVRE